MLLTEIVSFGMFVGLALHYRRRSDIHRPMMLLATICIISASLVRSPYISHLAVLPPLYVYLPAMIIGALLFILQWAMTGTANRWYAIGYAGIAVTFFVSVAVGNSSLWSQLVAMFVP